MLQAEVGKHGGTMGGGAAKEVAMQIRTICAITGEVTALALPIAGYGCPAGQYEGLQGICVPNQQSNPSEVSIPGEVPLVVVPSPNSIPIDPPGTGDTNVTGLPIGPVPKCCKGAGPTSVTTLPIPPVPICCKGNSPSNGDGQ